MSEIDPLRKVLKEWQAQAPSAALDERVHAAYRARVARSPWTRLWTARVSIPVPILLAATLLIGIVWLLQFRTAAPAHRPPDVLTRLETTGFQPTPNGIARVEEARQ